MVCWLKQKAVSQSFRLESKRFANLSWSKNTSVRQLAAMEEESLVASRVEGRGPVGRVAQPSGNHRH
jgi:hypothetical protein